MARIARPLTALEVERLDTSGLHAVGTVPGLCLRIPSPPSTARSWSLRLLVNGKRRELGLGGYPDVSLVQAVASARERRIAEIGSSPKADRGAAQAPRSVANRPVTFAQAAEAYISMHTAGWKDPLHASAGAHMADNDGDCISRSRTDRADPGVGRQAG